MAVLRAIVPRNPLYQTAPFQAEIQKALDKVGKGMKGDFEGTVSTWKHKPEFSVKTTLTAGNAQVEVTTDDEIYGYVSGGTKPHEIRPKTAKILRFQGGFVAKTSPRSINSGGGGASGDFVFTNVVHHPGNAPRHFERQVVVRYQDVLPGLIQSAIHAAISKQ
jgi:hypothetical protein